jgi:hypothetical protein
MMTRRGLHKKGIVICDPRGHRGKNSYFEDMMNPSLHGLVGETWEKRKDFKKIIAKLTVTEDDEAEGIEPRLDFIWIDMTRTGDDRLTSESWYRDYEALMNGVCTHRSQLINF